MTSYEKIRNSFLSLSWEDDFIKYFEGIESKVKDHRHSKITLNEKFEWTIGSFEDTIFEDDTDMLETWEEFYLPEHMRMQVIGTITSNCCTKVCPEIVIMVCEDGKVYAYREMHLHLVADKLEQLFYEGLSFPGKERYYYCQRFEEMTKADMEAPIRPEIVKKHAEEHKETLESLFPRFKAAVDAIKQNQSKNATVEERAKGPIGPKGPKSRSGMKQKMAQAYDVEGTPPKRPQTSLRDWHKASSLIQV